jgi:hypothetical protein
LALWGRPFASPESVPLEAPQSFTLAEARQRAWDRSFDSRLEFEHLLQASQSARAAYLNLLPHLSLIAIASNLPPSASGLASSIGDLAPFLLPNRWIQARRASLEARVQEDAWILMRADLALQIEGLSYGWARDQEARDLYQSTLTRLLDIQAHVRQLEDQHRASDGATDHLESLVNTLRLDLGAMTPLLQADRAALSQALGFVNPEAVTAVALDPAEAPIAEAAPLDAAALVDRTLARAYELRQVDTMLDVARTQKKELLFNWMDPYGDYRAQLGFELGAQLRVARSRIHEVEISREQLRSFLIKKLYEAVEEHNHTLVAYPLAAEALVLHERRLQRILAAVAAGAEFEPIAINEVLSGYLASAVRARSLLANYRGARAKIQRLLWQPPYDLVPFVRGDGAPRARP